MLELFQMWALVEVLGIMCLPLTITVFHNLPDRGWAFNKAIAMALLAFCVWLPLMYFQSLPFSQMFIAGVVLILLAINILGFVRVRRSLVQFLRSNTFYIVACEVVFLGMMFLLGWLRSYSPDIRNFEMFMDEGFLSAIMRSPHFPPNDMWLSGYPINYYYYAHFTIAVLAKLLGQPSSIAFNTGICTFFGLTAVNLFGVTCNIVAWARHLRKRNTVATAASARPAEVVHERPDTVYPSLLGAIPFGFLTILMGLVMGNLASTQNWWIEHGDLSPYYWFDQSRVIDKTINEFPAFSFLLSCFHAHVLALAFTIVAIGLALNLFLERDGKGLFAFGRGWRLPLTLGTSALILGGLFTMNGWDFPTYLGIALICIALQQWLAYRARFSFSLVLDVITAAVSLGALSFFLYAPFYLNFISPSQGIGIVSPADRSPIGNEVEIYGTFAFIFLSLLLASLFRQHLPWSSAQAEPAFSRGSGGLRPMTGAAEVNGAHYNRAAQPNGAKLQRTSLQSYTPALSQQPVIASSQTVTQRAKSIDTEEVVADDNDNLPALSETVGAPLADTHPVAAVHAADTFATPAVAARARRLDMGLLPVIIIIVILAAGLFAIFFMKNSMTFVVAGSIAALGAMLVLNNVHDRPRAFTLLLGTVAFALVAGCEIFFLKDVFADNYPRMNTVFKFYFQAWAMLSIACGAGTYFILESFHPAVTRVMRQRVIRFGSRGLWVAALLVLLLAGAIYPVVASYQRTNDYAQRTNSLDGLAYMQSYDPADYYAIQWLNTHVQGDPTIVEAIGPDYSDYGRISAFTGLPTVMGWVGHEYQWRVNWLNNSVNAADFYRRGNDVSLIYTDKNSLVVLSLMTRYQAEYLYVGPLEKATYSGANLERFSAFMQVVYAANGVTIYKVK